MSDYISREDAEAIFRNARASLKPQDYKSADEFNTRDLMLLNAEQMIHLLPSVTPSGQWNNHQIACLLTDLFGDTCACNYNGIDEWLPMVCDFKDTCCPKPVGVACWEQFLKHYQSRYTECGYEVR